MVLDYEKTIQLSHTLEKIRVVGYFWFTLGQARVACLENGCNDIH